MRVMTFKAVFLDFATVSNGDLDMSALRRVLPDVVLHDVTPDADIPYPAASKVLATGPALVADDDPGRGQQTGGGTGTGTGTGTGR